MHRSGNQPDEQRSLGEAIKSEVNSALQLFFKNVEQHSIDTTLPVSMVAYVTEIPCQPINISLDVEEVAVSSDPISILKERTARGIHQLDLIPSEALLAENTPCEMTPALCHEPVIEPLTIQFHDIGFENMEPSESLECPIEVFSCEQFGQVIEAFTKPETASIQTPRWKVDTQGLLEAMPKFKSINDPRFYALPIKKAPIPPHRFSTEVKAVFRKALAEKAKTHANNVQLRVIYERMNMMFFASIQQDEQGNLLCTPKNELIGKNKNTHKIAPNSLGNTYLVYGFRLDTKEDVRALVPANHLPPPT